MPCLAVATPSAFSDVAKGGGIADSCRDIEVTVAPPSRAGASPEL